MKNDNILEEMEAAQGEKDTPPQKKPVSLMSSEETNQLQSC